MEIIKKEVIVDDKEKTKKIKAKFAEIEMLKDFMDSEWFKAVFNRILVDEYNKLINRVLTDFSEEYNKPIYAESMIDKRLANLLKAIIDKPESILKAKELNLRVFMENN